jgi:hypothetical protein
MLDDVAVLVARNPLTVIFKLRIGAASRHLFQALLIALVL